MENFDDEIKHINANILFILLTRRKENDDFLSLLSLFMLNIYYTQQNIKPKKKKRNRNFLFGSDNTKKKSTIKAVNHFNLLTHKMFIMSFLSNVNVTKLFPYSFYGLSLHLTITVN